MRVAGAVLSFRPNHLSREGWGITGEFHRLLSVNTPYFSVRLVPKLFYKCDQGQADPVVAVARDQSSVYLKLLMHEAQPPSHFSVSTITRYARCVCPNVGSVGWGVPFPDTFLQGSDVTHRAF